MDPTTIKEKTKKSNPNHIKAPALLEVPDYIFKWHQNVTLRIDIFYVNKMAFFHTISRKIQLRTVEYVASENKEVLLKCLSKVIKMYESRCFSVQYKYRDTQFQCLRENVMPIKVEIASRGEHVPEVEQSIKTIKGDIRMIYHALLYKKYPPLMIKGMVEHQVSMRNKFPGGISKTMGPLSIVTGVPQPSYSDFILKFGLYVQIHDHPTKTNNMRNQTTPAVALKSTGSQNGWYFMSLETGKQIVRYKWTALTIPNSIIEAMHAMVEKFKQKNKERNAQLLESTMDETEDEVADSDLSQYSAPNNKHSQYNPQTVKINYNNHPEAKSLNNSNQSPTVLQNIEDLNETMFLMTFWTQLYRKEVERTQSNPSETYLKKSQ